MLTVCCNNDDNNDDDDWLIDWLIDWLFSRDILQSVIDADLSDAAFPFSTHKVVFLLSFDH